MEMLKMKEKAVKYYEANKECYSSVEEVLENSIVDFNPEFSEQIVEEAYKRLGLDECCCNEDGEDYDFGSDEFYEVQEAIKKEILAA